MLTHYEYFLNMYPMLRPAVNTAKPGIKFVRDTTLKEMELQDTPATRSIEHTIRSMVEFRAWGREVFSLGPIMQEMLVATDLEKHPELTMPYPSFYLALENSPFTIWGGERTKWHQVAGIYVTRKAASKADVLSVMVWGRENERSLHGTGDDASFWFDLNLSACAAVSEHDIETHITKIFADPSADHGYPIDSDALSDAPTFIEMLDGSMEPGHLTTLRRDSYGHGKGLDFDFDRPEAVRDNYCSRKQSRVQELNSRSLDKSEVHQITVQTTVEIYRLVYNLVHYLGTMEADVIVDHTLKNRAEIIRKKYRRTGNAVKKRALRARMLDLTGMRVVRVGQQIETEYQKKISKMGSIEPFWRRGHRHWYWTGPLKDPDGQRIPFEDWSAKRKKVRKWIQPVLVGRSLEQIDTSSDDPRLYQIRE